MNGEGPVALLYMAWNRLEFTRETFLTLLQNTDWHYVSELFVYDDGSQDGTYEWLEEHTRLAPVPVRLIRTDFHSHVLTILHCLDNSTAPIIAKTDNDAMMPPGWLRISLQVFARHPELLLLGTEALYPHSDDLNLPRTYLPSPFISGLGLYRRSAFARSRPEPSGVYFGFEEWQMAHVSNLPRGWIVPALPVFLLDRFPFEPWTTYSQRYIQLGWQRPWGHDDPRSALWCWRWPSLSPPFLPAPEREQLTLTMHPTAGVAATDLRQKWPWPDDSYDHIRADDLLPRLPDKIFTMNELWRILKRNGTAEVAFLTTDGPGAFQDPTYCSHWNRRSMLYYQPGTQYHAEFAAVYGIRAQFRVLQERTLSTQDGPRLTLLLQAVKPGPFHVVILSNNAANLVTCINALLAHESTLRPEQIVVVDDGARAEAEAQLPPVRWVDGAKPFNYARNVNLGLAAAGTDVILLDDDTQLYTPDGLQRLIYQAESQPYLGICSAGIQGVIANPQQMAAEPSQFRISDNGLVFVCAFFPHAVYAHIGPLDEQFDGYGCADIDYCLRVQAAGLRLGVWDGCVVDHSGVLPSTYRTRPDLHALFEHNRQLFRQKWGHDL